MGMIFKVISEIKVTKISFFYDFRNVKICAKGKI